MALPNSGQISFSNLRTELGIPSQAPFSITSAATGVYVTINQNSPSKPNSTAPHAISEWYGYNHTTSNVVLDVTYITDVSTPNNPAILSILLNETTTKSFNEGVITQINLNAGGTFRVTGDSPDHFRTNIYIRVISNIRGVLFEQIDSGDILQTPTYTGQSGEIFQIDAEIMNAIN